MFRFVFLLSSISLSVEGTIKSSQAHRGPLVPPIEYVIRTGQQWPYEVHEIVSEGYHIKYHRIPGKGRPVLFMNGIQQSSATTLVIGKVSLLVKEGFDVWLGNYRGGMYGLKHDNQAQYNTKNRRFWDFTLEELGNQDLRRALQYIYDRTGGQRVVYVGFSMGTTMFWVLAASDPEYTASRVEAMVAIGPVARASTTRYHPEIQYVLYKLIWKLGVNQFLIYNEATSSRLNRLCNGPRSKNICKYLFSLYNKSIVKGGVEFDTFMKSFDYYPAGMPIKVTLHLLQIAKSGKFRQYDYGRAGNFKVYKKYSPPEYNLTAVNIPTYFVYSDHDELATTKDVEWLMDQLGRRPQVLLHHKINHFSHIDFNLNRDAPNLLDKPVAELILKITKAGGPVDIEELKL